MIVQLTTTKSWLQSRCIFVPDDWLQACVDWIQEENAGAGITQAKLNDMVYEQWLLSDLHELGTSCLPVSLPTSAKFNLIGTYALQIDSIVDVSQSYYSQQQKLKGTENANINVSAETSTKPWEPKPTRMLMMNLTDGSLNVQGMEYRSISQIDMKTPPGCKILVQGDILCRQGILMLTDSKVRILGGEVDALVEQNTPESLLHQAIEKNSVKAGGQIKQEFKGSQIQRRNISNVPGSSKNRAFGERVVKQEINTQKQLVEKGVMRPPVPTEDDNMWGDDLDFKDFVENMEDELEPNSMIGYNNKRHVASSGQLQPSEFNQSHQSNSLGKRKSSNYWKESTVKSENIWAGEPQTKKEEKRDDSDATFQDFDFDDDFDMDSILSASTPVSHKFQTNSMKPSHTLSKHTNKEKNSHPTATVNTYSANTSIKKENLTGPFSSNIRHKVMLTKPEFDDDMYDFDFEAAMKDDPLSKKTTQQTTNTVSPQSPNFQNKPVANDIKCSELQTNHNTKPDTMCPPRPDVEIHRKMNKTEQASSSNTLDRYFNTTCTSVSDIEDMNVKEQVMQGEFTELKSKFPNPSVVDSLKEQYFKMQERSQPIVTSNKQNKAGTDAVPFTYLSLVQQRMSCFESFHCSVKGYISTLTGKLDCENGRVWKLTCKINDGSASMDVQLSNQVLTELIGFSVEESFIMRKRARQDPSVRDILTEGLQQCQQKLIDLSCLMDLQVNANCRCPEVVGLRTLAQSEIETLYSLVTEKMKKFCDSDIF